MSPSAPAPAAALLEREELLATLRGLLEAVRTDRGGRLIWVSGEAGAGKTELLRHLCAEQAGSARILWGACEPLHTPRPLGPFLDVAESIGARVAELVGASARPHEVAAALLAELRGSRTTILVLEDLHWADEATLDVITLLARRIGAMRVLALGSYRDDGLARAGGLRALLGELARRGDRLRVEPLSRQAVARLAEPDGRDVEELYRLTRGNPFYVTEVLAAGGQGLPETVRDAVLARVALLGQPARELLEAAAIVPGEVELWLLNELTGGRLDGLEECLASGTLGAFAAAVSFRHELARTAIEESILPTRRLALHRAALLALERRGDLRDLARLAFHAEAAGAAEAVLRWAPPAAEQASDGGSHREAAGQYGRALRFAAGLAPGRRAELLERHANECWLSDQFDAAVDAQQAALECRRALGDRLREGDAMRTLSRLLFFVGRVEEGEALATAAVELLEGIGPSHELAMAYGNVSQRRMVLSDLEETLVWGGRALELARGLDDIEAVVYALTNIGSAEAQAGRGEGREKQERALTLALEHGLEDYAGRAFMSIIRCAAEQRAFEVVDAYMDRAVDYCRERGLDTWRLYLLAVGAQVDLARGRWDQAADVAALVLRDPRSAALPRGHALSTLGLLRARRGDPGATELLEEERARCWPTHEIHRIGLLCAAMAEAAWLAGEPERVERETGPALRLALERRAPWVAGELACWRWRAGIRDDVPPEAIPGPYGLSLAGRWADAAAAWRGLGCPYEATLALADSDDEGALRQALDEFRRMGARPAAQIVARRLRQLGARGVPRGPRPATRENPAGLTARELEVLALVAEGLRNSQIARRLVVSEKTVDHHVSAILRKLDAGTRGEAAAQASRLGLTAKDGERYRPR